jgi:hypothetical protein
MDIKWFSNESIEAETAPVPLVPGVDPGETAPWEEIETGRYMPRRIRGSYHGRELG